MSVMVPPHTGGERAAQRAQEPDCQPEQAGKDRHSAQATQPNHSHQGQTTYSGRVRLQTDGGEMQMLETNKDLINEHWLLVCLFGLFLFACFCLRVFV